MPMNIWQASGGPSRVVAFWGENQFGHFYNAAPCGQTSALHVLLVTVMAALVTCFM